MIWTNGLVHYARKRLLNPSDQGLVVMGQSALVPALRFYQYDQFYRSIGYTGTMVLVVVDHVTAPVPALWFYQ